MTPRAGDHPVICSGLKDRERVHNLSIYLSIYLSSYTGLFCDLFLCLCLPVYVSPGFVSRSLCVSLCVSLSPGWLGVKHPSYLLTLSIYRERYSSLSNSPYGLYGCKSTLEYVYMHGSSEFVLFPLDTARLLKFSMVSHCGSVWAFPKLKFQSLVYGILPARTEEARCRKAMLRSVGFFAIYTPPPHPALPTIPRPPTHPHTLS